MNFKALSIAGLIGATALLNSCQQVRPVYIPGGQDNTHTGSEVVSAHTGSNNNMTNSGEAITKWDGHTGATVQTTDLENTGLEITDNVTPESKEAEFSSGAITTAATGTLVADHPFGNPVYFAYNKADISENEHPKLKYLAEYLSKNPSYELTISGHSDERGSEEYNRALSERRALAVKKYVVSQDSTVENRIKTIGYGEDKQLDSTGTPEGHAKNRRAGFELRTK